MRSVQRTNPDLRYGSHCGLVSRHSEQDVSPTDATLVTLASQNDEAQASKRPGIRGVQRSAEAEETPGQADHASICALLDSNVGWRGGAPELPSPRRFAK
ncbi:hypothetical protein PMIN04_008525 [Paraphaeosphaeria minitans]